MRPPGIAGPRLRSEYEATLRTLTEAMGELESFHTEEERGRIETKLGEVRRAIEKIQERLANLS